MTSASSAPFSGAPIVAENLVRHFGDVKAVNGINLTVNAGEIFGFLGPNGAGKSTVVRMLTTLLRPTSGKAMVAGFDVAKNPDDVRRRIGVALQDAAIDPLMTGTGPCTEIGPPNASPPGVTTQTHPEEAPSGTWAVMRRLSTTVKTFAASRLVPKRTADAPKRLVPLSVTVSPTFTRFGLTVLSCGDA